MVRVTRTLADVYCQLVTARDRLARYVAAGDETSARIERRVIDRLLDEASEMLHPTLVGR